MTWLSRHLLCIARDYTSRRPPDFVIGDHQLDRWWVFRRRRLGGIYLHRFNTSDDNRALHDHPWVSLGLVLGPTGYADVFSESPAGGVWAIWREVGSWTFRGPRKAHRVELLARDPRGDPIPVYTLFFVGPVVREWGFHCPQGWRPWKEFVEQTPNGNRVGKGCSPEEQP